MAKKAYKKSEYTRLYSDCGQMNNPKPDFKNFAADLLPYDQICN
jgi:hypothetical protein